MWPFPYLVYKHLYSPSSSSTPATCVTSLSKPQNIFLIEFAEQPKSPRMLSHPSTIDLLLNLHPTYIQIIQLPNIALGVQPDSTGELATFMPFSQISAFNLLPKHFFVIIWSHPPPHPVHVSREPGRRSYPNYPITWWHFPTSWIKSKDLTASPIVRAWTIDNWH